MVDVMHCSTFGSLDETKRKQANAWGRIWRDSLAQENAALLVHVDFRLMKIKRFIFALHLCECRHKAGGVVGGGGPYFYT